MRTVRPGQDEAVLREAAARCCQARHAAALTGAGVSVESGIPDFRSAGGLWTVFPPEEYATLEAFRRNPAKAWRLYRAMAAVLEGAQPNPAHRALARLEEAGRLHLVVTQNVDGLHQEAGSREVVEIHGDHHRLQCLGCGLLEQARAGHLAGDAVPACPRCGAPLKPNVVLFGEAVRGMERILAELRRCDLLLVAGTSAQVHPAAGLPALVCRGGGLIYEFNLEETSLTTGTSPPEYFFRGPAGMTLERFARAVLRD